MILAHHHYAVVKVRSATVRFEGSSELTSALPANLAIIGGDDRDRTGDLLRARQVLSQLSYVPTQRMLEAPASAVWWAHLDLNQGPRPYQGRALTG
jgi:hypothetical protein